MVVFGLLACAACLMLGWCGRNYDFYPAVPNPRDEGNKDTEKKGGDDAPVPKKEAELRAETERALQELQDRPVQSHGGINAFKEEHGGGS